MKLNVFFVKSTTLFGVEKDNERNLVLWELSSLISHKILFFLMEITFFSLLIRRRVESDTHTKIFCLYGSYVHRKPLATFL